jgi:acyl-CoA synthetase (AMP-forming)/AMP-acid ligase II
MSRLLRGKGPDLGPVAGRFPQSERTMSHVLARRASERPDRTRLAFDGDDGAPAELTYGAAQAQVNQLGHALLRDLGGPAKVGLFMRNQVEFFPALYGSMAARGVAVPVNADSRRLLLQRVIAFRAWLEEWLPRYMVPRYLELRAELPKSASAKVQKHLLVEAGVDRPEVLVFDPKSCSAQLSQP